MDLVLHLDLRVFPPTGPTTGETASTAGQSQLCPNPGGGEGVEAGHFRISQLRDFDCGVSFFQHQRLLSQQQRKVGFNKMTAA